MFMTQRFLSGSSTKKITLWNNTQRALESGEIYEFFSIDYRNGYFVSATLDNIVRVWTISQYSIIYLTPATRSELKSVLILNETTCLAGYENYLYLWKLPNLNELRQISSTNLNKINVMIHLDRDNLVLIGSLDQKIHVFSLVTETIIDTFNTEGGNKYALDALNRNIIVSNCNGGICSFYLNINNQLVKNKSVSISSVLLAAKIINSSIAIFGFDNANLVTWDLQSTQSNQKNTDNGKIRCIEILDENSFLSGMESDKILIWNLKTLTIKHTITTSGTIYTLKNIEFDIKSLNANSGLIQVQQLQQARQLVQVQQLQQARQPVQVQQLQQARQPVQASHIRQPLYF
ncbi:unnamed protein product [Brachionus calyciflorus]|uniref:Uncharacterized protein n=1 Tax=Brachionus calyciflorus TaxID=104777 RepID=A0A814MNG7_9BILA|nr:unnamed protein product [Brachionus calyciflorus]